MQVHNVAAGPHSPAAAGGMHGRRLLWLKIGFASCSLTAVALAIVLTLVVVNQSDSTSEIALSTMLAKQTQPDPALFGRWETVIPDDNGAAIGPSLGVLAVHNILLPSGKILIAAGSSWRNQKNGTEFFPKVAGDDMTSNNPTGGK